MAEMDSSERRFLTGHERATLLAAATTALPAGRRFPGADEITVDRAETFVANLGKAAQTAYRGLIRVLDAHALASQGGRFSSLPLGRRLVLFEGWNRRETTRLTLRGLLAPLKIVFFDDDRVYAAADCRFESGPPVEPAAPAWHSQMIDGWSLEQDEALECDAVVVGTGAGGAVVAKELAEAGFAVLLLEEGRHFKRSEFTGRPVEMTRRLYRNSGLTVAIGSTIIPVPVGKTVGGTTTINAGTCLRPPRSVFAEWGEACGLPEISIDTFDPYYRRVEAMLGVEAARLEHVGTTGSIIARGCEALGYSHRPLRRNAPDCDGQGFCCLGCPTDAKRSTNVSYIPAALQRSAQLITRVKVERILVERETAVGVQGSVEREDGRKVTVTVRSQVVVVACGALHTPVLLLGNGLANSSGELGRNLSIHPAGSAFGVFDELVDGSRSIPQGYLIDQFQQEGIMFEGGTAPLEILAASHSGFGPGYVDLFERFNHLAQFGFMVKDTSRGRVRPGPRGDPLITYTLNAADMDRIRRAIQILSRVLFAAGAREVHTTAFGFERLRHPREAEEIGRSNIAARHIDLSAWHPLGTARMGRDPMRSVVDTTHETHDVHNLFVTDGSSIPGSPGVNPQLTIMAFATRAAEFIARRIERLSARSAA
jgi:choline dehydrogenase-like flavoprotein